MIYDGPQWQGWLPITEALKIIEERPGAYVFRCRNSKPIARAVGEDADGVLDIGESTDLWTRINAFLRCADRRWKSGHMAGWRHSNIRGFCEHFPLDDLEVKWCYTDEGENETLEAQLLTEYLELHMELPPLNYQFNWKKYPDGW